MSSFQGLSSLRSFGQSKTLSGSGSGAAKTLSISSRTSSESLSSGSFANMKIAAEKLVKEQASAKTDLNLANAKLQKLTEHIGVLEEKLQTAFNENAKLKVKQKEDEKIWKGLESKFSSTNTLCEQLTETLQHLASQVQDAENDKDFFEDKLSASSVALDIMNGQLKSLSLRLVRNRDEDLGELCIEKDRVEKSFRYEQNRLSSVIEEKDAMIKNHEATITSNGVAIESLNSKLGRLHLDLDEKEQHLQTLRESKEILVKETENLLSINKEFADKLEKALQDIKELDEFVNLLSAKFVELESQSLTFSEKVVQLNDLFESCFKLVQEEKKLAAQIAQKKLDKLQDQTVGVTAEKNALQLVNQELHAKINELQKEQESAMVQHAEECCIEELTIRKLESEVETLICKSAGGELKNMWNETIHKLYKEKRLWDTEVSRLDGHGTCLIAIRNKKWIFLASDGRSVNRRDRLLSNTVVKLYRLMEGVLVLSTGYVSESTRMLNWAREQCEWKPPNTVRGIADMLRRHSVLEGVVGNYIVAGRLISQNRRPKLYHVRVFPNSDKEDLGIDVDTDKENLGNDVDSDFYKINRYCTDGSGAPYADDFIDADPARAVVIGRNQRHRRPVRDVIKEMMSAARHHDSRFVGGRITCASMGRIRTVFESAEPLPGYGYGAWERDLFVPQGM